MTQVIPSVIVTLPARTAAEARHQIREAQAFGADLAEVRIDRFSETERNRLGTLFPCSLPLVATVRSRAEGGEGPDDAASRAKLFSEIARHPFRWIDVEASRDLTAAEGLAPSGGRDLIVSTHLRDGAPPEEWSREFRRLVPPGSVRKVVGRSTVGALLASVLPGLPPAGENLLVAHTTGPSGPLLRAWSKRLGLPFVYAALPEGAKSSTVAAVEPSQIPVDRLKRFLAAEGTPPLYAVVGRPVAHSRSPAIHARWMQEDHRPGLYVALEFDGETEFADALSALVEGGFRGFNVTHPLKAAAFELADTTGPGAEACGVANTLSVRPDGVEAENTDLSAILQRLGELRTEGRWDGSAAGVIGAGGAARATLAALRSLGVETFLWARREEAREALAREFGARAVGACHGSGPPLVVHATPFGRTESATSPPPDLGWLRPGAHLLDWVYLPDDPVVRTRAEQAGATYEDGSRLLVYQAAASYGIWWGSEPSAEQIATAVEGLR
ncbi:MAG TPA: type I 3-dehydroquinate dehydratase [Thermoplasmata archaeon]|nr:type I 3-dehydroquinate dehydratase [Thermoplasmata archaeon]